MFDVEAYWQSVLQGEAFAQQMSEGDEFLGAFGHVPYAQGYLKRAWITGFLDVIGERRFTIDAITGLISHIE